MALPAANSIAPTKHIASKFPTRRETHTDVRCTHQKRARPANSCVDMQISQPTRMPCAIEGARRSGPAAVM
eukprot:2044045-Prymnesium_polylepis.1